MFTKRRRGASRLDQDGDRNVDDAEVDGRCLLGTRLELRRGPARASGGTGGLVDKRGTHDGG
jgi:hypothetical protein